jgi:hypothetical protein
MESGVDFVAADNPHANKLMVHMLAAFAEHEREQISQPISIVCLCRFRLGCDIRKLTHLTPQDRLYDGAEPDRAWPAIPAQNVNGNVIRADLVFDGPSDDSEASFAARGMGTF